MAYAMPLPDVIIYGGAFDPPHRGHEQCVQKVCEAFSKAQLLLVPSAAYPAVRGVAKSFGADFMSRQHMLKLAFSEYAERVSVSDIELGLSKPNYTVNTLKALKHHYPNKRLGLLVGSDQALSFPHWYQAAQILESVDLVIVKRQGFEIESLLAVYSDKLHCQSAGVYKSEYYECSELSTLETCIYTLSGEVEDIASHVIKANLHTEAEMPSHWLNPKVLDFLQQHDFYNKG